MTMVHVRILTVVMTVMAFALLIQMAIQFVMSLRSLGVLIATACNYNLDATDDDDSCTFEGDVLDCDGNCLFDIDGDGICDQDEVAGCTNSFACNYNSYAIIDNGSCEFLSCIVFDCADTTACNYNPDTDFDDGSCVYANYPYDCNGECVEDNDGDGVCDINEIPGCDDVDALNYNPTATDDNGTCIYPVPGCMDASACNYNDSATVDDGTCEFTSCVGCTDINACNYDALMLITKMGLVSTLRCTYDCDGNCINDADARWDL